MKACYIPRVTCIVLLTGVLGTQYFQPALQAWISAPSVNEMLVRWEPPAASSQVSYYSLSIRNILTDHMEEKREPANATSHLFGNLIHNASYSINLWWTGTSNTDSTKKNFTDVPLHLYRRTMKRHSRPRLPAMAIFYGTIGAAVFVYVVAVVILIVFACKRRQNSEPFLINLSNPERRESLREDSANDCSAIERYSKAEDSREDLHLNRISTFTGRPITSNRINTISDSAYEGYERPISIGYLHPTIAFGEAPELPARNQHVHEDEHVYQEPDPQYSSDKPDNRSYKYSTSTKKEKKSRKKQTRSSKSVSLGRKHKKKMDMTSASGSQTIGRHHSMNTAGDDVAVSSNATVKRNDSMKSLTIWTDVTDAISCSDISGIGDGFQITLTLKSKPGH